MRAARGVLLAAVVGAGIWIGLYLTVVLLLGPAIDHAWQVGP